MAFFPGQMNQAGGTWVDPSRVQTSQSGGAYIGGMAPQQPTQDMSFMWGGNGGAAAPSTGTQGWLGGQSIGAQAAATNWSPSSITTYPGGSTVGAPMNAASGGDRISQGAWDYTLTPEQRGPTPAGSLYGGTTGGAPQTAPAAGGWSQSMLNTPAWAQPTAPSPTPGMTSSPSTGGGYGDYSGSNPYQSGVADDMQRRVTEMLGQSFAGIRGNAVGVGGTGGTREGVAQGLAGQGAADSLAGQLAGMNSQNWNASQNRGLQQYGMDTNNTLQNKSLDNSFFLGDQGQKLGFYSNERGMDQADRDFGLRALMLAQSGAWGPVTGMTGAVSPYASNGTTTASGTQGGGAAGAVGGTIGTYQLLKNLGLV